MTVRGLLRWTLKWRESLPPVVYPYDEDSIHPLRRVIAPATVYSLDIADLPRRFIVGASAVKIQTEDSDD